MQGYAIAFAVCGLCSLMFVGNSVQPSVDKVGKIALAVFTALFIGTEILAFMG